VVGTQNRIDFNDAVAIAAGDGGGPDCAINPAIGKPASTFTFIPAGCTPGLDCSGLRAFVLSFEDLAPIPDGSVLYTCRAQVTADTEPGNYVLGAAERLAAGAAGELLPADGEDAVIEVGGTPLLAISLGDAHAAAGQRVEVPVRLDILDDGIAVAGTQNDIHFPAAAAIAATDGGEPDCVANAAIDKDGTSFFFLPVDCTAGLDCTTVRAVVLALDNVDPIADQSELYRCAVQIAADAAVGTYVLRNSDAAAAGPTGDEFAAQANDGEIEVVCPGDCDGDGEVGIGEILRGVALSLGDAPTDTCMTFDLDADGQVAITEIVRAVSSALEGC
jgi:hypothetical protein